jgi:hypothetical protein
LLGSATKVRPDWSGRIVRTARRRIAVGVDRLGMRRTVLGHHAMVTPPGPVAIEDG